MHFLVPHGDIRTTNVPTIMEHEQITNWFNNTDGTGNVEGIVWHCKDNRMFKVSAYHQIFFLEIFFKLYW